MPTRVNTNKLGNSGRGLPALLALGVCALTGVIGVLLANGLRAQQRTALDWRDLLVMLGVAVGTGLLTYVLLRRPAHWHREIARRTEALAMSAQQLEAEIIERSQVEGALRRSEARLRAIMMSAADGIVTFDETGAIQDFNPTACRILGREPQWMERGQIWDVLPEDQRAGFAAHLARLADLEGETLTPMLFEAQGVGQNKLDVSIALGRAPVMNGWLYTAIVRDMTETRRAEEMLQVLYERLYTVVSNAPVVVFAVDADGIFTLSEGSGLSEIGSTSGQMVGKSIFDLYADNSVLLHAVRTALGGKAQSEVVTIGQLVYDAWYQPMRDKAGQVSGVMGVAHDVTRRKHAEDALTSVLDTVGDSVVVADQQGRIVMANRQVESVFGYRPDALIGHNVVELIPTYWAATQKAGQQPVQGPGEILLVNQRLQVEGLHRTGRVFPLEVVVGRTQIGSEVHFTASMRDITQEKELEKLRDDFISSVSHELRTPLASIMGWLETILDGRPGPLNETQTRFLTIAYTSAERLNRLVEEILTVSRINRGTLFFDKVPFNPSDAVSAAVDMLDGLAAERDIAIIVNDDWPHHATVAGDRDRFDQVLANLLSNAVKFSPDGGVVEVRSEMVDEAWRLEVADHGIGIPHEEVHRLFQRFYRASNAAQAQIQGTGLGLYICKAIVEAHHGRIWLESDVGQGTTVWFSVPIAAPQGAVPSVVG